VLPIGVASWSFGRDGRPEVWMAGGLREVLREREEYAAGALTGRAFGEGGMARPRRGVRAPPF